MQIIQSDEQYIISTNTYVLQTIKTENRIETLIMENNKNFVHPRKSYHLIRSACHHYGTSFNAAEHTAKSVLNNRKKVPIAIAFDHGTPLIMMPMSAPKSEQNIWIAFHAVANFKSDHINRTEIKLMNDHKIKINVSETTFRRQFALAGILHRTYQRKFSYLNGPWTPSNF